MKDAAGATGAAAPLRSADREVLEEQLERLQKENAHLKKSNMEKTDTVKKLGVQLVRIRNDWQQQAAPKAGGALFSCF